MESKTRKFLGAIIAVSAIGMIVIKYISNENIDSYMLPLILLFTSVVIISNKSKKSKQVKAISKKQHKVILSSGLIALGTGIIIFFVTLF